MSISIDYDLCENTGVCATICPDDVFHHQDGRTEIIAPAACIHCWLCVESCTASAIELE